VISLNDARNHSALRRDGRASDRSSSCLRDGESERSRRMDSLVIDGIGDDPISELFEAVDDRVEKRANVRGCRVLLLRILHINVWLILLLLRIPGFGVLVD
jgi:hypothetical protein